MAFKIGDKVKFLNEKGGGIITRQLNNKIFGVTGEDGFEIPMPANELVFDNGNQFFGEQNRYVQQPSATQNREADINNEDDRADTLTIKSNKISSSPVSDLNFFNKPVEKQTDKKAYDTSKPDDFEKSDDNIDIYVGFLPKEKSLKTECDLDLYLINDSNYYVNCLFVKQFEGLHQAENFIIEPNSKEVLFNLKRKEINNCGTLIFQMTFFKKSIFRLRKPVEAEVKIYPPKFFLENSYKINDFFDDNAIISPLYIENPEQKAIEKQLEGLIKAKQTPDKDIDKGRQAHKQTLQTVEVDLHIEELIDSQAGMQPKEILDIQMDKFNSEMKESIKNPHINKIIFIHGVGNGVLKKELRKTLDTVYKKYRYQDASFKEYGYGATLVFLK